MHSSSAINVPDLLGTVHPFMRTQPSFLHVLRLEVNNLLKEKEARKIVGYITVNLLCTLLLLVWCSSTDSLALTAYTFLTFFDVLSMLTCLVTLWVKNKQSSPFFSFGYERFEVLAVFASTILAQLGSLFIIKESVERMFQQPEIHTGRLLVGTAFAFIIHLFVTYNMKNPAFNHVVSASSSSWLQEHVSDISESLCHMVPGLSKLLLPRINPFVLIACAGASSLVITYILIDVYGYFAADTWAAVLLSLMTCGTMFPMSVYSGKILLHTTPSHTIGQLDKCIREASTLDGVLEFRHEHFWTVAFGKMAGSVHVRVRRDADEQMVLAHVYHRLANLISVLTVQIFKDDWSRPSAFQILGDANILSKSIPAARVPQGIPQPVLPSYLTSLQHQQHHLTQTAFATAQQHTAVPVFSASASWQHGPAAVSGLNAMPLPRTTLTPHIGVRFPPIPHYTDALALGGVGNARASNVVASISDSSSPSGYTEANNDNNAKYK